MTHARTNSSKIGVIVSIEDRMGWIAALLNVLRKLPEEIYS